ncbi:3-oxo-tetronate kinase [Neorhizobium alkalisoli]|uniref:3-oxo-tetronate kinase n=1 Tax=Neorhizobium alkalisoli TaxID=528178 RepID=A0A561R950_9HYPH|nr:3-oxo-tetronate kinase [Neorhizobium alkalisoli]TWF59162.1 uncharacterized protein YgbK (DUF1537 family) [Neorhizobium alkalisoli]
MLLGVIADDFTGASDIANTLAKGYGGVRGFATTQFLGVPRENARAECEAGVVALKTRSIPPEEAIAQSLEALAWLRAQGCRQIVFKYCSTFDSTPQGNIGPVGEALAAALGAKGVVVCPAFPGAGRTLYRGNLFVGDVPLNESSLRDHPLNPMTDSDIRRWLRQQAKQKVGSVNWDIVRKSGEALRAALHAAGEQGETLVVVDAISDEDLLTIGAAVKGAPLLTGGSGIALGLAANFASERSLSSEDTGFAGMTGREAVLAGSCSQATLSQIDHHLKAHPGMAIDVEQVMDGSLQVTTVVDFVLAHGGEAPLVYSSNNPQAVRKLQQEYGRETIADKLDGFFGSVASSLVANCVERLVVAGGETSGAVVSALDLDALTIGPEIAPGVPILTNPYPLALALKSGNFGQTDFFERALGMMAGREVGDTAR